MKSWWNNYFPSDPIDFSSRMPNYSATKHFWLDYFPPISILLGFPFNNDQFWRKVQKILQGLLKTDVPCPFLKRKEFISFMFHLREEVKNNKTELIISFLEQNPCNFDENFVLWMLPEAIGDVFIYFQVLYEVYRRKHWIWSAFFRSLATIEHFIDKEIVFLEKVPYYLAGHRVECMTMLIEIITGIICSASVDSDFFKSVFPKFFDKLLCLVETPPVSLQIHAVRTCFLIIKIFRTLWNPNVYLNILQKFIISSMKSVSTHDIVFRNLIPLVDSNRLMSSLFITVLTNNPNAHDIYLISIFCSKDFGEILQYIVKHIIIIALNNSVLSRTCLSVLPGLVSKIPESVWIKNALRNMVRFIVLSQMISKYKRKANLIMELFQVLYESHVSWIQADVSFAAGIFMSCQKVPLSMIMPLKPTPTDSKYVNMIIKEASTPKSIKSIIKDLSNEDVAIVATSNPKKTAIKSEPITKKTCFLNKTPVVVHKSPFRTPKAQSNRRTRVYQPLPVIG